MHSLCVIFGDSFMVIVPQDCYDVVQKTTLVILHRLQHVIQLEVQYCNADLLDIFIFS